MASDPTINTKVRFVDQGDTLDVATGGKITANGTQGAALTTQLTALTIADAVGTPDYAIAAITQTTPFGFAGSAEAITVLYVIQNLQVRVAELEARLQGIGAIA